MVRYGKTVKNPAKSASARGSYLRVHFKNTHEVGAAIAGMNLTKALEYLEAVKDHKRCIPFRRFAGATGRTGQAKEFGTTRGRWPVKSVEFVLGLLQNAKSNAVAKKLNVARLYVKHMQVNQAPKQRRRTFRAHGRVNPYLSSPSHIELILTEKPTRVPMAGEKKKKAESLTRKSAAKLRTIKRTFASRAARASKITKAKKAGLEKAKAKTAAK